MNIVFKSFLFVFIIVFLSACYPKLTVLQQSWPVNYHSWYEQHGAVYDGYIIKENHDSIAGLIRMWNEHSDISILPYQTPVDRSSVINYHISDIKYIRLYKDNIGEKWNFIDVIKLNSNELAHLAGKRNDVSIYDYNFCWRSKSKKKLVTSSHIIEFKNSLKFINARYHENFKGIDFKNESAMIDYILDKENEKIGSAKQKIE